MEMVWDWKSITSLLATAVFIRSAARDFIPPQFRYFLDKLLDRIYTHFFPTSALIIEEYDPSDQKNEIYEAVQTYLSSRCLSSSPVLRLSRSRNSKMTTSSLPSDHSTTDVFEGVEMNWKFHSVERGTSKGPRKGDEDEKYGYFKLCYHQRYTEMVRQRYVEHIMEEAARIKLKSRERRLYTNQPFGGSYKYGGDWSSVPFNHPSTFQTLAIDPELKESIRNDLLQFSSRRDYYSRVGRSWKRGYLLYGPPGTGKTSLIAAIANFLEFDIYDIELTAVHSNTQLRKLLVSTSTKSVIVVEDVDCSLDLSDRNANTNSVKNGSPKLEADSGRKDQLMPLMSSVSLSGVLNFVDGLWSSCVGERLMIFTTNHPEKLDPAMLRPGRMDRKINLGYCGMEGFKVLAKNYLEVEEGHEAMKEVEDLIKGVRVTPADIAEIFMGCDGCDADFAMRKVVEELIRRRALSEGEKDDVKCTNYNNGNGEAELGKKNDLLQFKFSI